MFVIPQSRLAQRLVATRAIMADAGVDTLVVWGNPSRLGGGGVLHYLCGWSPGGAATVLIVPAQGDVQVISAGPNVTRVFNQRLKGFGTALPYAGTADMAGKTVAALQALGTAILATYAEGEMPTTLRDALASAFAARVRLDKPLHDVRLKRDDDEIAMHRRGADIAVAMVDRAMQVGAMPDATPAQIMTECEVTGRRMGSENASIWLATGEHPPTTYFELFELNATLGPNDRVQLGATIQLEGYYSQCLRTGVRGTPSQELLDCTARLIDMQDKALATLVPGQPLSRLSDVLEAEIDAFCPYERTADPFRFQSCHAIGINYAEPSCAGVLNAARDKSRDGEGPLVTEGMVIEIHPNFTLPSLGHVCTGDMALVTAAGAEWITNSPRQLFRL